ncbi:MAG: dethiobiotin synthase [Pseudomonadales bacterium]|nr:dethiobiotin synthase [Pseudomonadales bacterium]NRA16813.1 dethiobiotin synthase [Oceanospirillaceae bacterium]
MAKHKYFIAGTDTDVGKTFISQALLEAAKQRKMSCYGLKPIAAGCEMTDEGLRNEDALKLMQSASVKLTYQQVNPIALQRPVAPHIAAKEEGRRLDLQRISGFCRGAMMNRADFVLVEGAGGWRVPLNNRESLADIPKVLSLPVILVVGVKLGCINHALLTVEAIHRDGVTLAGWVANHIDPQMQVSEESVATLKNAINAPLLGVVPFLVDKSPIAASRYLQLQQIL